MEEAARRYARVYKDHPQDRWVERQYILFKLEMAMDYRGAYRMLKKCFATPGIEKEDATRAVQFLGNMVESCWFLKKEKEREEYYSRAKKLLESFPGGEEGFVGLEAMAPSYLYQLGKLHLFGGNGERARECFQRMMASRRCDNCHYGACHEAQLGMGLYYMVEKKYEEAAACLRRCLEIVPHCTDARYYLQICEKKENGKLW